MARTARWPWTASVNPDGYGQIAGWGKRSAKAHRVAYDLQVGPIPDGLCVLHHCDNPPCVNGRHLYLGTPADNAGDREARGRGRHPRGMQQGRAKLTDDSVREIRRLYETGAWPQRRLAARYGVTKTAIAVIVRGEAWRHVGA